MSALRRTVKRDGQSAEDVASLTIKLPEFQKTQMPRAKSTLVFRTGSLTCRISATFFNQKVRSKGHLFLLNAYCGGLKMTRCSLMLLPSKGRLYSATLWIRAYSVTCFHKHKVTGAGMSTSGSLEMLAVTPPPSCTREAVQDGRSDTSCPSSHASGVPKT